MSNAREATSRPMESLPNRKPFSPGADSGNFEYKNGSPGYIILAIAATKITTQRIISPSTA